MVNGTFRITLALPLLSNCLAGAEWHGVSALLFLSRTKTLCIKLPFGFTVISPCGGKVSLAYVIGQHFRKTRLFQTLIRCLLFRLEGLGLAWSHQRAFFDSFDNVASSPSAVSCGWSTGLAFASR